MKSSRTKACDISPPVRAIIDQRDPWCVLCGAQGCEIAHYIPRSRGGLEMERNLVKLCMSDTQLAEKRVSRETGMEAARLHRELDKGEMAALTAGMGILKNLPLNINRKDGATVPQILAMAQKVPGLRLVVIDYLGLIQSADKKNKSLYEKTSEISRKLKRMARRLKVPVLCRALICVWLTSTGYDS